MLTAATFGASFNNENLNASESKGLCRKRSELGYSFNIISNIEGPVNSNLLAPPTKHTAILDRNNSSFEGEELAVLIKGRLERRFWTEEKDERAFKVGAWKKKNMIKEKRGIINTRIRQLISENRLVNGYIDFVGLFIIFNAVCYVCLILFIHKTLGLRVLDFCFLER